MITKKIISILCAAALLLTLAAPVFADEEKPELELVFSPAEFSYKKGDTVEVTMRVINPAGLNAGNIFISFDKKHLKFISAEEDAGLGRSGLILECGLTYDGLVGSGFMNLGGSVSEEFSELELFHMVFEAKKDGSGGLKIVDGSIQVYDKKTSLNENAEDTQNAEENKNIYRDIFFIAGVVIVAIIGVSVINSLIKKQKQNKK